MSKLLLLVPAAYYFGCLLIGIDPDVSEILIMMVAALVIERTQMLSDKLKRHVGEPVPYSELCSEDKFIYIENPVVEKKTRGQKSFSDDALCIVVPRSTPTGPLKKSSL